MSVESRSGWKVCWATTLASAAPVAEEAHDDDLRARIATKLVYVTGKSLMRREASDAWATMAVGVLRRMGGNPELEADLEVERGVVLLAHNQSDTAATVFEHALQLYHRVDPNHWRRPHVLANLGSAYGGMGENKKAAAMLEQASAVVVKMVRELRNLKLEPMKALNDELRSIENEADRLMLELYRDIYSGRLDNLQMFLLKEFFEILEKAIDRCREAGVVAYEIVLKNS